MQLASSTFGRWRGTALTVEKREQLLVPRGFAHGFCSLELNTEVAYKVDTYYVPGRDAGLIWDDACLGIDWPIPGREAVLSAKDATRPHLADFRRRFIDAERK